MALCVDASAAPVHPELARWLCRKTVVVPAVAFKQTLMTISMMIIIIMMMMMMIIIIMSHNDDEYDDEYDDDDDDGATAARACTVRGFGFWNPGLMWGCAFLVVRPHPAQAASLTLNPKPYPLNT